MGRRRNVYVPLASSVPAFDVEFGGKDTIVASAAGVPGPVQAVPPTAAAGQLPRPVGRCKAVYNLSRVGLEQRSFLSDHSCT